MVSLIPYRKITFTSPLSIEEIKQRICGNITDARLYKWYDRSENVADNTFVGVIETNTFRLRRIAIGSKIRSQGPIYRGRINENVNHRSLAITAHPSPLDFAIWAAVVSICYYILATTDPNHAVRYLGFVVIGYILMMVDFNIHSHGTLQLLKVIMQSQSPEQED